MDEDFVDIHDTAKGGLWMYMGLSKYAMVGRCHRTGCMPCIGKQLLCYRKDKRDKAAHMLLGGHLLSHNGRSAVEVIRECALSVRSHCLAIKNIRTM